MASHIQNIDLYPVDVQTGYIQIAPPEGETSFPLYTADSDNKPFVVSQQKTPVVVRVYSPKVNASWFPVYANAKGLPMSATMPAAAGDFQAIEIPPSKAGEVWASYDVNKVPKGIALPDAKDQANDISVPKRRLWINTGKTAVTAHGGGKDLEKQFDLLGTKPVKVTVEDDTKPPGPNRADLGFTVLIAMAIGVLLFTRED